MKPWVVFNYFGIEFVDLGNTNYVGAKDVQVIWIVHVSSYPYRILLGEAMLLKEELGLGLV